MKFKTPKKKYVAPSIEVIAVENEGVMASSVSPIEYGGGAFGGQPSLRNNNTPYNASTTGLSDLEDMISNILTFEK